MDVSRVAVSVMIVVSITFSGFTQTKLACVGNSITAGTSGPSYVPLLQTLLGAAYSVQNDGLGGTTLLRRGDYSYWTTSQFHDVFTFKPAIITIKLGTNDSKSQNWSTHSSEFAGDLNALIDTFQTISPKPQIWLVLCAPSWSNGYGINGTIINNEIVPLIRSVATARSLPLIDCNTPLLNSPSFFPEGVHPNADGADSISRIFYHSLMGKPIMKLSDTLVTHQYYTSQPKAIQTSVVTVVNTLPGTAPLIAPVTVSNKRPWLSVTVNAAKPDSQVITNTVDPASLPDVEQKYYDTVTVQSANALVPMLNYRVMVWIRESPVLASVSISPDTGSIPSSNSFRFSAIAFDQYDQEIQPQPAFTWSATGGSVDNNGLFTAPGSGGTIRVTISVTGNSNIQDTANMTIAQCSQGLEYDYYANTVVNSVNDIASHTPTTSGVATAISLQPAPAQDSFALRFTGYLLIPTEGQYSFFTSSDDGSALVIDGLKVVDNDGIHAAQERSGDIALTAGLHPFTILFYELTGGQSLAVQWQKPGFQKTAIPDSVLFYADGATNSGSNRIIAVNASKSIDKMIDISLSSTGITVMRHSSRNSRPEYFSLNGVRMGTCVSGQKPIIPQINKRR